MRNFDQQPTIVPPSGLSEFECREMVGSDHPAAELFTEEVFAGDSQFGERVECLVDDTEFVSQVLSDPTLALSGDVLGVQGGVPTNVSLDTNAGREHYWNQDNFFDPML